MPSNRSSVPRSRNERITGHIIMVRGARLNSKKRLPNDWYFTCEREALVKCKRLGRCISRRRAEPRVWTASPEFSVADPVESSRQLQDHSAVLLEDFRARRNLEPTLSPGVQNLVGVAGEKDPGQMGRMGSMGSMGRVGPL